MDGCFSLIVLINQCILSVLTAAVMGVTMKSPSANTNRYKAIFAADFDDLSDHLRELKRDAQVEYEECYKILRRKLRLKKKERVDEDLIKGLRRLIIDKYHID